MVELTPQQRQELSKPEPTVIDPETRETYVLVRKADYERLKAQVYDDSPWTDEEMAHLAAEAGDLLDNFGK